VCARSRETSVPQHSEEHFDLTVIPQGLLVILDWSSSVPSYCIAEQKMRSIGMIEVVRSE
jgi:hypothetical protein